MTNASGGASAPSTDPCARCDVLHASAQTVAGRTDGILEPVDESTCALLIGGNSLGVIALIEHIAGLADRYRRAAHPRAS